MVKSFSFCVNSNLAWHLPFYEDIVDCQLQILISRKFFHDERASLPGKVDLCWSTPCLFGALGIFMLPFVDPL